MYDTHKSYLENYQNGPDASFVKNHKFPKVNYTGKPTYEFLGIPLFIPFGVPAGPLLNAKFVKVALDAGFSLPTYKTVRSQEWASHPWPNILKIETKSDEQIFSSETLPKVNAKPFAERDYLASSISISNSFGVPSQSPEVWSKDFQSLKSCFDSSGQHTVLSFQGTGIGNTLLNDLEKIVQHVGETVEKTKGCLVELNLSCPNEVNEPIYKSRKDVLQVLKVVNSALKYYQNIKLIVKIGAMDFDSTYAFVSEASPFIHAVSAINTVSARILTDAGHTVLGSGTETGGVCGSVILRQGLLMCDYLAKAREKSGLKSKDLGLIGVGGVSQVTHFNSYRDAGADVVQAATGMMWNLDLAQQIATSLKVPFNFEP